MEAPLRSLRHFACFRRRIDEEGAILVFEVSAGLNNDNAKKREITVFTKIQEKNMTFPTDVNLLTKIITKCRKIAADEGHWLRHSFRRELSELLRQRFNIHKAISVSGT